MRQPDIISGQKQSPEGFPNTILIRQMIWIFRYWYWKVDQNIKTGRKRLRLVRTNDQTNEKFLATEP